MEILNLEDTLGLMSQSKSSASPFLFLVLSLTFSLFAAFPFLMSLDSLHLPFPHPTTLTRLLSLVPLTTKVNLLHFCLLCSVSECLLCSSSCLCYRIKMDMCRPQFSLSLFPDLGIWVHSRLDQVSFALVRRLLMTIQRDICSQWHQQSLRQGVYSVKPGYWVPFS